MICATTHPRESQNAASVALCGFFDSLYDRITVKVRVTRLVDHVPAGYIPGAGYQELGSVELRHFLNLSRRLTRMTGWFEKRWRKRLSAHTFRKFKTRPE